ADPTINLGNKKHVAGVQRVLNALPRQPIVARFRDYYSIPEESPRRRAVDNGGQPGGQQRLSTGEDQSNGLPGSQDSQSIGNRLPIDCLSSPTPTPIPIPTPTPERFSVARRPQQRAPSRMQSVGDLVAHMRTVDAQTNAERRSAAAGEIAR